MPPLLSAVGTFNLIRTVYCLPPAELLRPHKLSHLISEFLMKNYFRLYTSFLIGPSIHLRSHTRSDPFWSSFNYETKLSWKNE